ncbi:membrane protein [Trypanosoma grayi]|uniref:membrane protein n=1 Tax=Trypanosoma grayi TaxID=71804 RepID=UPI0004F47C91|nr:membrane protein [Trypanosoma grayi]KEG10432.1 membrane protein [Trypanosoma grayi]
MVSLNLKLDVTFSNFKEFYIYYLAKHMKQTTRRCHFLGTLVGAALLLASVVKGISLPYAIAALVAGYGIAWAGDVAVEGTTPTSFKYPWWSFRANMLLVKEVMTGKQSI